MSETHDNDSANDLIFRRHLSSYGIGRILAIASQFLTVLVLSRIDGELYLKYTLVLAVALAISSITFGWLRQAILRDSSAGRRALRSPQVGIQLIVLMSGIMTAVVSVPIVGIDSWSLAAASIVYGTSFVLSQYYVTEAQASLRPLASVRIETIRLSGTAILPLLIHLAGVQVSLAMVLGCAATATFVAIAPEIISKEARSSRHIATDFAFGFPIAIWLLLSTVLQFSDRWIIAARVGVLEASEYAATYDLMSRGATAVLAPVVMAAHPLIMAAVNRGTEAYDTIIRRALWSVLPLAGLLVVGATVFSFVGDLVAPAADHSFWLAVTLVLSGCSWQVALLLHKPFEVDRRTVRMAVSLSFALVLNIVANWYIVPILGALGVALMNVLAIWVYVAILYATRSWYVKRRSIE